MLATCSKTIYGSLTFMNFGHHSFFLHIWTVFVLKWYLDKDRNMLELNAEFGRIQNIQLKYWGYLDIK